MKNMMSLGFAVTALVVSGVCLHQARQLQTHTAEIADLQHQVQTQAGQLATLKASQERLKKQRLDLADKLNAASSALESAQQRATIASSNAAAATASAEKTADNGKGLGGFGSAIAKMFDNPGMKR